MKHTYTNLEKKIIELKLKQSDIELELDNVKKDINEYIVRLCIHIKKVQIGDAVVINHNGKRSLSRVVDIIAPANYPAKPYLHVNRVTTRGIWSNRVDNCLDNWEYIKSKEDHDELLNILHNETLQPRPMI